MRRYYSPKSQNQSRKVRRRFRKKPLGPAERTRLQGRRVSGGKPFHMRSSSPASHAPSEPLEPLESSGATDLDTPTEDLDSEDRGHIPKRGKANKRVAKKKPKSIPVTKRPAADASITPRVRTAPVTSVAVTVSVESPVSTVAKKSRRTTAEQLGDDVKIDIEEFRQACVGSMTQMLG